MQLFYLCCFLLVFVRTCSAAATGNGQAPWAYTITYPGTTPSTPATYTWAASTVPFLVATYTIDLTSITDDGCFYSEYDEPINCAIAEVYPAHALSKLSVYYSNYGAANIYYRGAATSGGCYLAVTTSLTCYTDTVYHSGTTEQIIVMLSMAADTTANCNGVNDRYLADMTPTVLYIDCSGYTSTSTTSTSTTTKVTTTTTSTSTTTTVFAETPAGIATIVTCSVVGAVALALIIYGIYKCCMNAKAVSAQPSGPAKTITYTRAELPPVENPKELPRNSVYYDGSPSPQFAQSSAYKM